MPRSLYCFAISVVSMVMLAASTGGVFSDDDESWNLDRHYRHVHNRNAIADQKLVHGDGVRNIQWSGIKNCNAPLPTKTGHESTTDLLPQLSNCPWTWVINHDPRRDPSTLLVAHCNCRHCRSGGMADLCQPVYYFRNVTYLLGESTKETKLYRLAVGCTCERRSRVSV